MKRNSSVEIVFDSILAFLDGALHVPDVALISLNGESYRHNRRRNEELRKQRRALQALAKRGYIEIRGIAENTTFSLTDKGRHQALLRTVMKTKKELPADIYCFVIFDIPERHRKVRRGLTTFLRAAGFLRLQKSVWQTKRAVADEAAKLIALHNAARYIRVVVGSEVV